MTTTPQVRNDYGVFSLINISTTLSQRVIFVKACHSTLCEFVRQFEDCVNASHMEGDEGKCSRARSLSGEALPATPINYAPARLSICRLIALLRGAKSDGTSEFSQAQELMVEHRIPAIVAQCTRIPFTSGMHNALQAMA